MKFKTCHQSNMFSTNRSQPLPACLILALLSEIIGIFKNQCKQTAVTNLSRIIYYKLMPMLFKLLSLRKCQKAVTDVLLNLASLKFLNADTGT